MSAKTDAYFTLVIYHSKKEKVTLTLLRLSQLQLNDTMSLPHWVFSYTLETENMDAVCRVSPECKQSNVCYHRKLGM